MDYEKEYKRKALEPIVNYIESVMASYSKEELEARIKKALPENESEDERIRQMIENTLRDAVIYERISETSYREMLAYLERQKEQKPTELPKSEDYGIDGLYAAVDILQKTFGEVEGYQTDDGILEHKCAISAVKELYEQQPAEWSEDIIRKAIKEVGLTQHQIDWFKTNVFPPKQEWSEEDEFFRQQLIVYCENCVQDSLAAKCVDWLKSLCPQSYWKPSEEQISILGKVFAGCELNITERDSMVDLFYNLKQMI